MYKVKVDECEGCCYIENDKEIGKHIDDTYKVYGDLYYSIRFVKVVYIILQGARFFDISRERFYTSLSCRVY